MTGGKSVQCVRRGESSSPRRELPTVILKNYIIQVSRDFTLFVVVHSIMMTPRGHRGGGAGASLTCVRSIHAESNRTPIFSYYLK